MKRRRALLLTLAVLVVTCLGLEIIPSFHSDTEQNSSPVMPERRAIQDKVLKGETFLTIFAKAAIELRR